MSEYKHIFSKFYVPNWSEKVFVITKVKSTVLRTYVISDVKSVNLAPTRTILG